MALDPRILKFSLGAIGQAVANITGYPDWAFSADQLEAISDSLTELELTLSPVFNCVLISVSILAGKSVAYVMWVRAGKPPIPGSSKKLMDQGQQEFEDDVLPELEK